MLLDGRDVIEFRGLIQILVMSFFSVKWVDPINEAMTWHALSKQNPVGSNWYFPLVKYIINRLDSTRLRIFLKRSYPIWLYLFFSCLLIFVISMATLVLVFLGNG